MKTIKLPRKLKKQLKRSLTKGTGYYMHEVRIYDGYGCYKRGRYRVTSHTLGINKLTNKA
jgi:hypothetical protein